MANGNEGSTPALGDGQARKLLEVLPADTLKGVCDRAILATLLYHGMRREELCGLRVRDMQSRQGVVHFGSGASAARSVRSGPCDGGAVDRGISGRRRLRRRACRGSLLSPVEEQPHLGIGQTEVAFPGVGWPSRASLPLLAPAGETLDQNRT